MRDDLTMLERYAVEIEAGGKSNWVGFRNPRRAAQQFEENALLSEDGAHLVVVVGDTAVGAVRWSSAAYVPVPGANCWTIGCTLLPDARGRGIGTAAHRALVDYLFSTTPAVRVEADTETDNLAERRCLEKAGFTQEGILRSVIFRAGSWRDVARYGLLRHEHRNGG